MWLLPPIDRGGNDPLPRGVVVLDLVLAGLLLVAGPRRGPDRVRAAAGRSSAGARCS